MPRSHETHILRPAIVLAVGPSAALESPMVPELRSLLEGLGYCIVGELRQRRHESNAALPIGSGKLAELQELVRVASDAHATPPLIAVASDLSGGHSRSLERALDTPVIDRTEVILRIFEARAETPLAKLEIERARLIHSLPRIRDMDAARRQQGGGGRAAKGHSNTELAKQAAARRIAELERRIETMRGEQARRSERRHDVARVALIGYTNVGKSSWMQELTAREISVKDELFHTLGTRVHALRGAGARILVTDTVGFLEDLPHTLLESFRSTLSEALDADLRLHVADASSPRLDQQLAVTRAVIEETDGTRKPELVLLNKADLLSPERRELLQAAFPEALLVSSRSAADRRQVVQRIRDQLTR